MSREKKPTHIRKFGCTMCMKSVYYSEKEREQWCDCSTDKTFIPPGELERDFVRA